MFQLRIYTLRSAEALKQYASIHWARHIPTFQGFRVTTHGIWPFVPCRAPDLDCGRIRPSIVAGSRRARRGFPRYGAALLT